MPPAISPFGPSFYGGGRGKGRKRKGFTPYQDVTKPPPGTYDPALDATLRAAQRGYGDLRQDTERDIGRSDADYATARTEAEHTRGQTLSDIMRNYKNLQTAQTSGAAASGLLGGGYMAQAARKRAENRGRETTRVNYATDQLLSRLALAHGREGSDRATTLSRAGREVNFFGQDTNESRLYQARATGWIPPEKPADEFKVGDQPYQSLAGGRGRLPSGQVLGASALQDKLRRAAAAAGRKPGAKPSQYTAEDIYRHGKRKKKR